MRARAQLVAAVGAASFALAGCEGSTDSQDPSAESPGTSETSESSASSASAAGSPAVPEPERGTCWSVPVASILADDYWFDDSAQVPCTEPHTTETAVVLDLEEATVEGAKERMDECWNHVRTFLGIDPRSYVPWGWTVLLPSEDEVAAGATWLRCEAIFPATTEFSRLRTTSGSAAGVADNPPASFWGCVDQPPAGGDQPFVPCGRPHRYEQTGKLAVISEITEYPAEEDLVAEAQAQCPESVPAGYGEVLVDAVWDDPATLEAGTSITGTCYMHRADGELLPVR